MKVSSITITAVCMGFNLIIGSSIYTDYTVSTMGKPSMEALDAKLRVQDIQLNALVKLIQKHETMNDALSEEVIKNLLIESVYKREQKNNYFKNL